MRKKRLNKSEKEIIKKLESRQNYTLLSLKTAVEKIISKAQILQSKIEREGYKTNYSSSSDILRAAEDVYRLELTLSQLGMIQSDLEYDQYSSTKIKDQKKSKKS